MSHPEQTERSPHSAVKRPVVVTGIGVITPLGDDPAQLFAALCAGKSGIDTIETFDTGELPYRKAGEVRDFNPADYLGKGNLRPLDRTGRLAAVAAHSALHHAGWSEEARSEKAIGLVLGTLFGSVHTISQFDCRALTAGPIYAKPLDFANSVINAAAGQTAIWHHLPGVNSTIAGGPAASLQAIGYAADLISSGRAEVVLAGGADELCYESYLGYHRAGMVCGSGQAEESSPRPQPRPIPFDRRRNGFAPGEGAAFLVLEQEEAALRRGGRILATVRSHATTFDTSLGNDDATASAALERAVGQALQRAGCTAGEITAVSASANGTARSDAVEARGLAAALADRADAVAITAVKSMLGEPMGAGGVLQVATLIAALTSGTLPGIAGFSHTEKAITLGGLSAETQILPESRPPIGLTTALGLDGPIAALLIDGPSPAIMGQSNNTGKSHYD